MGPKKEGWEYAGDADVKRWHTFEDHSLPEKTSEFGYRDGNNIGNKSSEFPDVGYQENPRKE